MTSSTAPMTLYQTLLPVPRPAKAEPLLAYIELKAYSTSLSPWKPGLRLAVMLGIERLMAVRPRISSGWSRITSEAIFISRTSILRPKISGVRPTIRPAMKTVSTTNRNMLMKPTPAPP